MKSKKSIKLDFSSFKIGESVKLPASKSIANRAIVINALSGNSATLKNLSNARDTQLMLSLINSNELLIDARDAGTTMRFLTAFFAAGNQEKIMTGSARMKERPIEILVNGLEDLGAKITYHGHIGYPPFKISPIKNQHKSRLEIKADVSSQYISALMMIGPMLPNGLTIKLTGNVGSKPYIEMTQSVMEAFGAKIDFQDNEIFIEGKPYIGINHYKIEPDWSAASYWYSLVALSDPGSSLLIKDISQNSIQGDSVIQEIMKNFGVFTTYKENGAFLVKHKEAVSSFQYDFTHCPDLAQTIAVTCAGLGVKAELSGLKSLRIKETDRISALECELRKFGIKCHSTNESIHIEGKINQFSEIISIDTYEDHRMAMSFMPLCLMGPIEFDDSSVVAKSYPHFWEDVNKNITTLEG